MWEIHNTHSEQLILQGIPTECSMTDFNSDSTYLEVASDPRGWELSPWEQPTSDANDKPQVVLLVILTNCKSWGFHNTLPQVPLICYSDSQNSVENLPTLTGLL
jgi:hypothetical protein